MVERPRLLIGPWQPDESFGSIRRVRDADADIDLGVVRWTRRKRSSWWAVFSPVAIIEVFETEDRSLVMSLRPNPLDRRSWIVRDGDERELGRLRDGDLLSPWNEPFARRDVVVNVGTIRELDGLEYATMSLNPEGDLITFAIDKITNPFLRMLVIGSVLLLRPRPD